MNCEILCRTRVVGAFIDGNSDFMFVCARLRYVAGNQWDIKKYINTKHLESIEADLIIDS